MNVIDYINNGLLMQNILSTLENEYFAMFYDALHEKLNVMRFSFKISKEFVVAKCQVKVVTKNKHVDSIEFAMKFREILEQEIEDTDPFAGCQLLKIDCSMSNFTKYNKYNKETESVDRYTGTTFTIQIFLL